MNERKKTGIRPIWIFAGIFLGLPFILCSGVGLWWIGRSSVAQAELDKRKTAIVGRGYPIDSASLSEFHARNADDTYTGRWLSVLATLESSPFQNASKDLPILGLVEMPTPDQLWPEQLAVEKLLADYKATLDEIHEISQSDRPTRFPIQFDSYNTLLPEAQAMRNVSRLLSLEHEVALRTGNADAEYDAVQSMLGAAIVLRGDPTFVCQLISMALHGMAINAIQSSVERGSMDDQQLAAIRQRLTIFDDFNSPMKYSIAGERAFGLPVFEDPGLLGDLGGPAPRVNLLGALGSRPLDALFFLNLSEEMEGLADLDLDEFAKENKAFEVREGEAINSRDWLTKFDTMLSTLVLPSFSAVGSAWIRQTLQNRIAKTAVAIRRYKVQKGVYPDSISQLAEIGIDLNDTKALHGETFAYRVIDGAPTLWGYSFEIGSSMRLDADSRIATEPPPVNEANDRNKMWLWTFE